MPEPPSEPPRHPSSRELAELLQAPDEQALAGFVNATQRRVLAALSKRFGSQFSEADYEDAFADALARLWESRDVLRSQPLEPGAWLFVVARNALVDRLRGSPPAQKPTPNRVSELAEVPASELLPMVRQAVAMLSERERAVLRTYLANADDARWTSKLEPRLGLDSAHARVIRHRAFAKVRRSVLGQLHRGGKQP